jgi:hypothetical protein
MQSQVKTGTTEKPPPPRQHEDNRLVNTTLWIISLTEHSDDDRPVARQKDAKGKVLAAPALASNIANRASLVRPFCPSYLGHHSVQMLAEHQLEAKGGSSITPETRVAIMALERKLQDKKISLQQYVAYYQLHQCSYGSPQ